MKIVDCAFYRFHIPFAAPIRIGAETLAAREGSILALTDEEGRMGYGEVAPLPGLDAATLAECRRELSPLPHLLQNAPLGYDRFHPAAPLFGLLDLTTPWQAHVLFGVESALLGLYLQQRGGLPTPDGPPPEQVEVPVNGLFIPGQSAEAQAAQIRALKDHGYRTVKVKIGRLPPEEEVRQILTLVEHIGAGDAGPGLVLRLDGNRSLTREAYGRYYGLLHHLPVEYVEEPLRDGDLAAAGEVPWPLALDESLVALLDRDEPRPSLLPEAVRTVILKPGLLRGLHAMARCCEDAGRSGRQTVFSSSFNTGISVAILALFSRMVGLPARTAHGFDTLRYLAGDVLVDPPVVRGGMLSVPSALLVEGWRLNGELIRRDEP